MGKHELINQPTAKPTAKVTAAALSGVAASVVIAVADHAGDLHLSSFWSGLLAAAAAFAGGYVKKARVSEA